MENASRRYSYQKIKKMIEREQNEYGWEFLFLGANIDAIGEAAKIGIRAERAVRYECDSEGTRQNFETLAETVNEFRICSSIPKNWKNDIEVLHRRKNSFYLKCKQFIYTFLL